MLLSWPLDKKDIADLKWNKESAELWTKSDALVYPMVEGTIVDMQPSSEWWIARTVVDPVVRAMIAKGFGGLAPKTATEKLQATITIRSGDLDFIIGPFIPNASRGKYLNQKAVLGRPIGTFPTSQEPVLLAQVVDRKNETILNPLTLLEKSAVYPSQIPDPDHIPPSKHRGTPRRSSNQKKPKPKPAPQPEPSPAPEPRPVPQPERSPKPKRDWSVAAMLSLVPITAIAAVAITKRKSR